MCLMSLVLCLVEKDEQANVCVANAQFRDQATEVDSTAGFLAEDYEVGVVRCCLLVVLLVEQQLGCGVFSCCVSGICSLSKSGIRKQDRADVPLISFLRIHLRQSIGSMVLYNARLLHKSPLQAAHHTLDWIRDTFQRLLSRSNAYQYGRFSKHNVKQMKGVQRMSTILTT